MMMLMEMISPKEEAGLTTTLMAAAGWHWRLSTQTSILAYNP
jgi:hypothetical protein